MIVFDALNRERQRPTLSFIRSARELAIESAEKHRRLVARATLLGSVDLRLVRPSTLQSIFTRPSPLTSLSQMAASSYSRIVAATLAKTTDRGR